MERQRIRGVCASRARLIHALSQAGLKTQSALADRIADLEGLEVAPRDLVSRAFRELPVDALSMERIAHALGVQAHTLYLPRHEAESAPRRPRVPALAAAGHTASAIGGRRRRLTRTALGLSGLLLTMMLVLLLTRQGTIACGAREWLNPPHTEGDRLGLIVSRFDNDPDNLGQAYMAAALSADHTLIHQISVITICQVFGMPIAEDASRSYARVRAEGQAMLRRTDALVLLWGRVEGNRLRVHFVSTRGDGWPARLRLLATPLQSREDELEIPLSLDEPRDSLLDIKTLALELMDPREASLRQARASLVRTYENNSQLATVFPTIVDTDSQP